MSNSDEEEKKIREALSEQLGINLATPEELAEAQPDLIGDLERRPEPKENEYPITVGEIIRRCNDAQLKMSRTNPHRFLFYVCATALNQLIQENGRMHQRLKRLESKVH